MPDASDIAVLLALDSRPRRFRTCFPMWTCTYTRQSQCQESSMTSDIGAFAAKKADNYTKVLHAYRRFGRLPFNFDFAPRASLHSGAYGSRETLFSKGEGGRYRLGCLPSVVGERNMKKLAMFVGELHESGSNSPARSRRRQSCRVFDSTISRTPCFHSCWVVSGGL